MHEEEYQYYIQRVTEESAFCALTEAGDEILPRLEAQFFQASSTERRAALIRIIWEYRNPQSLAFLAQALSNPSHDVWEAALDGLVAIGGEKAIMLLRDVLPAADQNKRE